MAATTADVVLGGIPVAFALVLRQLHRLYRRSDPYGALESEPALQVWQLEREAQRRRRSNAQARDHDL